MTAGLYNFIVIVCLCVAMEKAQSAVFNLSQKITVI